MSPMVWLHTGNSRGTESCRGVGRSGRGTGSPGIAGTRVVTQGTEGVGVGVRGENEGRSGRGAGTLGDEVTPTQEEVSLSPLPLHRPQGTFHGIP